MNNLVEFKIPTYIAISSGAITELPNIVSKYTPRVIIVTNKKLFEQNMLIEKVVRMLESNFISVMVFDDITDDTPGDISDIIANTARFGGVGAIIGIGGFKVLNVVKAAATVVTNRGEALDYVNGQKIFHSPLKSVAIPIILGSMSEINSGFYVFDKYDKVFKENTSPLACFSDCIVDTDLYCDLPDKYKFPTAVSIFAYAFDIYMSTTLNVFSEPFITDAMGICLREMGAMSGAFSKENTKSFVDASMLTAVASCHSKSGIIRNLSLLANGILKINSGVFAAIILPYVMDYYSNIAPDKILSLAKFFETEDTNKINPKEESNQKVESEEDATVKKVVEAVKKSVPTSNDIVINSEKDVITQVRKYLKKMQIPSKLSECGITDRHFSHISNIVLKYNGMDALPVGITSEAIMSILEQAF